jgi:hypothetical protein
VTTFNLRGSSILVVKRGHGSVETNSISSKESRLWIRLLEEDEE